MMTINIQIMVIHKNDIIIYSYILLYYINLKLYHIYIYICHHACVAQPANSEAPYSQCPEQRWWETGAMRR